MFNLKNWSLNLIINLLLNIYKELCLHVRAKHLVLYNKEKCERKFGISSNGWLSNPYKKNRIVILLATKMVL